MCKELSKNEKISLAMSGRKLSAEHKRNISIAKIGHNQTDYTREKIKNTLLGKKKMILHLFIQSFQNPQKVALI